MRLVWRVETLSGDGPFRGGGPAAKAHIRGIVGVADSRRHPKPEQDLGLVEFWQGLNVFQTTQWSFGFQTLKHYLRWFHTRQSRNILDAEGAVLRRYRVPKESTQLGAAQLIFLKDCASLLDERACNFI